MCHTCREEVSAQDGSCMSICCRTAVRFRRRKGWTAMRKIWVYDPHGGGVKIPEAVKERTRRRILAYAYAGKFGT